ncbi:SPFH domain-containing protein [Micromonospora echinospora]|uniref:SPFH domain-containing protein n=1 Tax=Micromonospora echinospora TaxID=1877 RepID=UPI00367251AA
MAVAIIGLAVVVLVAVVLVASVRVVPQHQRGVVFRFGRVHARIRQPGLHLIVPVADRMVRLNVQTVLTQVPAQSVITRDNVPLTVDVVVWHRVVDPVKALVEVRDYPSALLQLVRTALRAVLGGVDLDTVIGDPERVNAALGAAVDGPSGRSWGVLVERVELRDVVLPESLTRALCRQAEAERERWTRVFASDGEVRAYHRGGPAR